MDCIALTHTQRPSHGMMPRGRNDRTSVKRQATRCSLGSILSALVQGTPPMRLAILGGQAARARGFCPSMTAPVRPWPPDRAKASSAVGGPRGLLSAVGQREFLVRWQRGRRSDARLFCELRESVRSTKDCTLRTKEGLRRLARGWSLSTEEVRRRDGGGRRFVRVGSASPSRKKGPFFISA